MRYDVIYEYRNLAIFSPEIVAVEQEDGTTVLIGPEPVYTESHRRSFPWKWLARFVRSSFPTGPKKVDDNWYWMQARLEQHQ